MQLRITHTTGYEYDGKAITSYNEARLTPQTSPEQIVVHTRLDITPTPWTHTYRDYFGSQVTAFEVLDPHDALTVQAHATVHTNRSPLPPPSLPWADLATPEVADVHTEYLVLSEAVAPTDDFAAEVRAIGTDAATPGEAAIGVCALVHAEVDYLPGSTEVGSRAAVAWEQRAGVCQDMTHLAIGGLRTLGIPARYVSGYLHPRADPEIGATVQGESHAWVEWWDDGWHAFDLTNDQPIGDRHVVIAAGRDYGDVRPLSGIFAGSRTSRMFVEVEVTRLA
ncbi:transglutaminase family protein [Nocardioides sp. ChNu-153]|uniref:transglutaminase family protein n=1 Tax=unclassified Nocardioides TaxID=2615069 RepID=UPI002406FFBC|nr:MULTISPECIES: transglutaminase family protein [unclassified Nocardioides]MDF9715805.1 transglutaminase family protein [Nocardioides sp. ChNu-99]MDN7120813.1 transglutaminase family protein [Nocardioides sp. ChNu-153]